MYARAIIIVYSFILVMGGGFAVLFLMILVLSVLAVKRR